MVFWMLLYKLQHKYCILCIRYTHTHTHWLKTITFQLFLLLIWYYNLPFSSSLCLPCSLWRGWLSQRVETTSPSRCWTVTASPRPRRRSSMLSTRTALPPSDHSWQRSTWVSAELVTLILSNLGLAIIEFWALIRTSCLYRNGILHLII